MVTFRRAVGQIGHLLLYLSEHLFGPERKNSRIHYVLSAFEPLLRRPPTNELSLDLQQTRVTYAILR